MMFNVISIIQPRRDARFWPGGVAQDDKLAYVWSAVAVANGYAQAVRSRPGFAPTELAADQTLASQYVQQYRPQS